MPTTESAAIARATPALGWRPSLNGVRGLAIIFVLCRHSWAALFGGGGFVGVGLFFVLSGFLITTLLIEERERTGRNALGAFYLRRALRLLPALYFMLAGYVALALIFYRGEALQHALAGVGYAAIYVTPFADWAGLEIAPSVAIVWSLATEEYFYLIWPLLFILLFAMRIPGWARVTLVAVLALAFVALRWITWVDRGVDIYRMPWSWVDFLLVGCVVAMLWKSGHFQRIPYLLGVVAGAGMVAFAFFPDAKLADLTYGPGMTALAICGGVLVLVAVSDRPNPLARLLSWSPLRWFGSRSYALYLWNIIFLAVPKPFPVDRTAELLVGFALTLLLAEISYRLVEAPALRLKRRFSARGAATPLRVPAA